MPVKRIKTGDHRFMILNWFLEQIKNCYPWYQQGMAWFSHMSSRAPSQLWIKTGRRSKINKQKNSLVIPKQTESWNSFIFEEKFISLTWILSGKISQTFWQNSSTHLTSSSHKVLIFELEITLIKLYTDLFISIPIEINWFFFYWYLITKHFYYII